MVYYLNLSPTAFHIFGHPIQWYGVFYAFSIFFCQKILNRYFILNAVSDNKKINEKITVAMIFGMLIGARLGYMLLYDLSVFLDSPYTLFMIWRGGMSFHGGFVGLLCGAFYASRKYKKDYTSLLDCFAASCPFGIAMGRLANFINQEVYGRVTNGSFGVIYSKIDDKIRHPSQIYEFLLEGVLLIFLNQLMSKYKYIKGMYAATFCIVYSIARSFCESFREIERYEVSKNVYSLFGITYGQLLSVPIAILAIFFIYRYFNERKNS